MIDGRGCDVGAEDVSRVLGEQRAAVALAASDVPFSLIALFGVVAIGA